jgi:general secretion pathway protein D
MTGGETFPWRRCLEAHMKRILLSALAAFVSQAVQPWALAEPSKTPGTPSSPQVLIEAAILERSLKGSGGSGDRDLEPQCVAGWPSEAPSSGQSTATPLVFSPPANTAEKPREGLTYVLRLGNDFDAMLSSLARNHRAKVLQRPRIQTSDGVPATLFIGESRPCPAEPAVSAAATGSSAVSQLLIGTTFEVTPSIKADGLVTLDLHLQIERFSGNVVVPNVGLVPTTTSQEATAKLAVHDRDTILLGGWTASDASAGARCLPFPKELPVPKVLAGGSKADAPRKELMILVRPTLIARSEAPAR